MKIPSKQLENTLNNKRIVDIPKVVLMYGDDSGLVKELSDKIVKLISNGDNLAVDKISIVDVVANPEILYDTAFAVSMFASQKVVLIEDFINVGAKQRSISKILEDFLGDIAKLEDTYIVIPAVGLEATSALVKSFEKHNEAQSVRCFVDTDFNIKKVVIEFFSKKGKRLSPQAILFLQSSLGNNRLITMQELEKLDIYTQNKTEISLQDCLDCIVSADSVNLFKFCDSLGLGDKNNCQKYLIALYEEGIDPITILTFVQRHLKRLLIVKSNSESNSTPISAEMQKLRPPVFIGKEIFEKQVMKQSLDKLEELVFEFANFQKDTRLNSKIAKTMIENLIFKT